MSDIPETTPETASEVQEFIVKHKIKKEKQKLAQKKYNLSDKGRANIRKNARRYYYKKNDIYHPDLNSNGSHEKRYKK